MTQTLPTPAQAWNRLLEGNQRFAAGESGQARTDQARRLHLREKQNPIAVVLACSDSRVPVELVFDAGLGDVFVVRTAGEILDEAVMGSVSFGVNSLNVPLVIVLGHQGCGAVGATVSALDGGTIPNDHQRALVEKVATSVLAARQEGKTSTFEYERRHAAETASQLIQRMPKLASKVAEGSVAVVAARYILESGEVEFVASHGPRLDTPEK
ncbi:carbonic anhydrase [Corynebacterium tapiri]|uniref:Carbonic anhydrase n=1 Tax=Corynebacterium tapiri TaxID=1448266 RepID=A0A5C4U405_9CORY|nr:carbonic anhydrase [Corynebacterium tapiri]TNL96055.1 carbonic anhydrase [Corynebacterium tapiri]